MDIMWPAITPPPQYENADPSWEDQNLPDFGKLFSIAKRVGYSIGLHGSMRRDVDLIAVPWTEEAADPELLVTLICEEMTMTLVSKWEDKPHGRMAVNLQPDGWYKLIDLSIMPRKL